MKVANPWILTQKKKKKKPIQSKLEIKPRSRCWQRKPNPNTVYTEQKQTKPHYPILQYRGVYQKKKKKNPIQSKPNPRPRANQTHGETVMSLTSTARSVARRPHLVVVARSPLVAARRSPLVATRHLPLVVARRS